MLNRVSFVVAVAGCTLAVSSAATASVIHYGMLIPNESSLTLNLSDVSVQVDAFGGDLIHKTNSAGFSGAGVSGGSVNGEIDGNQSITFQFDKPTVIASLTVSMLFAAGNNGDMWNEIALFTTDLGSFTLEATGATSSAWTGFGVSSNDSPGIEGHGGVWTIAGDDIFGGAITSLVLSSGNPGAQPMYSDFAFHSMTIGSAVPAPGALALLLGAFAVGCSRRR